MNDEEKIKEALEFMDSFLSVPEFDENGGWQLGWTDSSWLVKPDQNDLRKMTLTDKEKIEKALEVLQAQLNYYVKYNIPENLQPNNHVIRSLKTIKRVLES